MNKTFPTQKSPGSEELTKVQTVTPPPKAVSMQSPGFVFGPCSPKAEACFLPQESLLSVVFWEGCTFLPGSHHRQEWTFLFHSCGLGLLSTYEN